MFVYKGSDLPYDQWESTKPERVGKTALNMKTSEVNELALKAMEKRLARGETSLISITNLN